MSANEPGQPPPATTSEMSRDLPVPSVALAVGAHPDDVEFGGGATLAKWAAAGCVVHHVVCTDGSKGSWDASADIVALTARRQDEQREAARRLAGERAGEVVFLGRIDGELENDRATRRDLARTIRRLRPDVVLGHDPWKRYRLHPDHRAAGFLLCDAVVAARDPHFFPDDGVEHHRPRSLLLWEADAPDHAESVGEWVDAKLHALEAHVSQFESTMRAVDDTQLDEFRGRVRRRLANHGAPLGVDAAELFKLIPDL